MDVLGRGVDTELFFPRGGRRPGPLRVLYAGRMHIGEKNLLALVDLARARPEIELQLAGSGPDLERIARLAGPRTVVHGRLSGVELAEVYRQADLFLFPSVRDTLGQVVIEAMASGLPTIVTDRGGPQELVRHGCDAWGSPPERFVADPCRLVDDPGLRNRLALAAPRAARRHSWDAVFGRLVGIASELSQDATPPARASDAPLARSA